MPPNRSRAPLILASVADAAEAAVALRTGWVDILDAKDPRRGPLGPCAPGVLRSIVAVRDRESRPAGRRRIEVSAALGDAADLTSRFVLPEAARGYDYVKIGLRGLSGEGAAVALLSEIVQAVLSGPSRARVIAVAYADAADDGCLSPALLPRVAQSAGADGCLIDTARKDGRSLFDHLQAGALRTFVAACRARGLICGLAGSLRREQAPLVREMGADVIGARGALCAGGREGRLDPDRVRSFGEAVRGRTGGDRTPA